MIKDKLIYKIINMFNLFTYPFAFLYRAPMYCHNLKIEIRCSTNPFRTSSQDFFVCNDERKPEIFINMKEIHNKKEKLENFKR